jgi:CubicO group peptidase (beta-lactamase class C family)
MVDVDGFWRIARGDHDTSALLALTGDRPAHFDPGADFKYNDSGYVALGAVIERVAGVPYASFVESMVRPLGMRNTWYEDNARVIPRRARGYSLRGSQVVNAPYISMTVPHAAGALASTADDLLIWTRALKRGEVVSRSLLDRAWRSRTLPDGTESGYGLGWVVCNIGGRATVEHGGWINGFTASAIALRDSDLTAIALVNRDAGHPSAPELAHRAMRLVVTGSPDVPGVELDGATRRGFTGTFRASTPGNVWVIEERQGTLFIRMGQGEAEPLVALSPSELTPQSSAGMLVLSFRRESNGRAASFETRINCEKGARWTRVE